MCYTSTNCNIHLPCITQVHNNLIGVIHTINAFIDLIRAGSTKKVISLSTGAADLEAILTTGDPSNGPYAMSKAALNMAVVKYANAFKDEGIVFLALSPGVVLTDTVAHRTSRLYSFHISQISNMFFVVCSVIDISPNAYDTLMSTFRKARPDFQGPISTEKSVRMQLEVIDKVTLKDTGAYISHHGDKEWL